MNKIILFYTNYYIEYFDYAEEQKYRFMLENYNTLYKFYEILKYD